VKASTILKGIVALALIGVIVWAIRLGQQRREQFEQQTAGTTPGHVAKVGPGAIRVDGAAGDWERIGEFNLAAETGSARSANDWESVRLAHDGTNLYALIALPYALEDRAPAGKGTAILGQVFIDTDPGASTADPTGMGGFYVGVDRSILVLIRRAGQGEPACVEYRVERTASAGTGFEKVENGTASSCDGRPAAGYEGNNVELALALPLLGLRTGRRVRFVLEPMGGSQIRELELRIP